MPERASRARLFEHRDVRVRAGAREARSKGSRADTTSARPSRPARLALVTFPERKVTRAVGRRGKGHGCRTTKSLGPGLRRDDIKGDRKSTRLNSSHPSISYAVFCLKKKKKK